MGSFSCGLQFMLVSNTRIAGRFLSCLEKVLCASINSGSHFLTDVRPRPYLAAWNLPQSFTKSTSRPHWSPETNFGLARVLTKTELRFQMAGAQDGKDSTPPPVPDPASPHHSARFIFIRNGFFPLSVITHYSNSTSATNSHSSVYFYHSRTTCLLFRL